MNRRNLLIVLGAALVIPPVSFAQQPDKIRRIGFLYARSRPTRQTPDAYLDTFVQAMRELGHVEGKNLVIEWRFADGNYAHLPSLAAELVQAKVEVIVTHLTAGAVAAQRATSTIPIVSVSLADPVTRGFATSLARPGGNVTGLTLITENLVPKQLELLRAMLPKARRLAILVNPAGSTRNATVKTIQDAGRRLGFNIMVVDARTPDEVEHGFAAMVRGRAEAVIIHTDALFFGLGRRIAELAGKNRLPSIFYYPEDTQAGGLMSYGQNLSEFYRLAAGYVDKILKGAKPGDLPIEQPMKIHLAINRKTAKSLGIVVPPDLLVRANELID